MFEMHYEWGMTERLKVVHSSLVERSRQAGVQVLDRIADKKHERDAVWVPRATGEDGMIVSEEQRRHPRLRCFGSGEVYFEVNGVPCPAKVLNLSLEGCLLILQAPEQEPWMEPLTVALDQSVEILFSVNQLPFRVRGQVKAIRPNQELGLQFPALSRRTRIRLEDLIEELRESRRSSGGIEVRSSLEPKNDLIAARPAC